jgi:hypothetical protein
MLMPSGLTVAFLWPASAWRWLRATLAACARRCGGVVLAGAGPAAVLAGDLHGSTR